MSDRHTQTKGAGGSNAAPTHNRTHKRKRRKVDATGRNKTVARFVMLEHWVLNSAAYKSLPAGPRALLIHIAQFHNGTNNGAISYSARQGEEELHVTKNTAAKWIRMLEERGFLICTEDSSFGWKQGARAAKARTWRLTMYPADGRAETKDFMRWIPTEKTIDGNATDTPWASHDTVAAKIIPLKAVSESKTALSGFVAIPSERSTVT